MLTETPNREPLLTVSDVAKILQISIPWVHQHSSGIRQPTIPSVKMGKSVRFRRQDVEQFIQDSLRAA